MSRRFPVDGVCGECNLPTQFGRDGEQRGHTCHFTYEGDATPWPSLSLGEAAHRLGVERKWLEGIAGNPGFRAVKLFPVGKTDRHALYRFNAEDVEALAAKMQVDATGRDRISRV